MRNRNEEAINDLKQRIPEVDRIFDLQSRIGNGTFSTVLLATLKHERNLPDRDRRKFAIKHHIPTSHPDRIMKELQCMTKIGGSNNVCGINCCLRYNESVAFIMPYMAHDRFNEFFAKMDVVEVQSYMRNLLIALYHVHKFNVIHRDVKPSNFLYNRSKRQFLLVDFGLAQQIPTAQAQNQLKQQQPLILQELHQKQNIQQQMQSTSHQNIFESTCAKHYTPKITTTKATESIKFNQHTLNAKRARKNDDYDRMLPNMTDNGSMKRLRPSTLIPFGASSMFSSTNNVTNIDTGCAVSGLRSNNSCGARFKMPLKQHNKNLDVSHGTGNILEIQTAICQDRIKLGTSALSFTQQPHPQKQSDIDQQDSSTVKFGPSVSSVCNKQYNLALTISPLTAQKSTNDSNYNKNTNSIAGNPSNFNKYNTSRIANNSKKCFCYGNPNVCNVCLVKKEVHASRAGTPGYRPPEVLLKYMEQTTAVDIWAAGVIFLSILSSVYPFFKAPNDYVALAELVTLFGDKTIRKTAYMLDRLVSLSHKSRPLDLHKLCVRFRNRAKFKSSEFLNKYQKSDGSCNVCKNCDQFFFNCVCMDSSYETPVIDVDELFPSSAYDLLLRLLEVNPHNRITAEEALKHPFLMELHPPSFGTINVTSQSYHQPLKMKNISPY